MMSLRWRCSVQTPRALPENGGKGKIMGDNQTPPPNPPPPPTNPKYQGVDEPEEEQTPTPEPDSEAPEQEGVTRPPKYQG